MNHFLEFLIIVHFSSTVLKSLKLYVFANASEYCTQLLCGKKSKWLSLSLNSGGYMFWKKAINKINFCITSNINPYHPLLSDNPLHKGSVRTFLSISFFHSIPSEITLYHSLQTLSAAHKDSASKKDKIFSAIWSKPLAVW